MLDSWKKGYKRWFRRENLVILILSGVLLFIVALPVKESGEQESSSREQNIDKAGGGTEGYYGETIGEGMSDYRRRMEQELAGILSKISGVGRVEVMITLKNSEERIIEKDGERVRSDTVEEDSQGGSRSITQTDTKESTVYETVGQQSAPYVVKTLYPAVEGVVVVAEGADTGRNNKDISDAVCALFGIEAHKVKVVKMQSQG
ncbi:MAG: stage III sporulation protein AG [Roseburia sp.]|nr:stage III sporulation protein AG [Roseburia sp.]